MSKTEKTLLKILGILAIIWVIIFIFIYFYTPYKIDNREIPQKFPFVYVSSEPEIQLLWNPSELVYTGVTEISGKKEEFILSHSYDKIYAFPTSHFAHICHPELFRNEGCKCIPSFEGEVSYHTKDFSVKVTQDPAGIFAGELPVLTFTRYDIREYKDGAFADDTEHIFQYRDVIDVSGEYGIALVRDEVEDVHVGIVRGGEESHEFVLYTEEDNFYALPLSHLTHMAHPSLFPDDECMKETMFEGKTVYENGRLEIHVTKDSSNIFGGELPKITFSASDKNECFAENRS